MLLSGQSDGRIGGPHDASTTDLELCRLQDANLRLSKHSHITIKPASFATTKRNRKHILYKQDRLVYSQQ